MTLQEAFKLKNRTPEIIAEDYLAAKKLIKEMQLKVDEYAAEIIEALGKKDEGSKTHNINGFKVEISQPVTRTADMDELAKIEAALAGDPKFPATVIKKKVVTSLDETGVKWYRDNEPAIYARLAAAITAKPGKTAVTIVRTE
jgi:hypothetical protein